MYRVNPVLQVGDRVRLINLQMFLDMVPEDEYRDLENLENEVGVVTAIAVAGASSVEQPRYIDVRLDSGVAIDAISIYHVRRLLGTQPEPNFRDAEDEELWFHMTNVMDFGG